MRSDDAGPRLLVPYGSQHGNAVAAIVGSRDSAHLGMAHGVDKLIDPLGANSTDDWLLGFGNDGEAPAADLPEVVNDSSGVTAATAIHTARRSPTFTFPPSE